MTARTSLARSCGLASSWVLRSVLHRSASTLPGRIALAIDPRLIGHLASACGRGSIAVCGTNGKTTTNNLLASALEQAGMRVLCNRAGANMATGVASALLPGGEADWGVFEVDELSTVQVLPDLRPRLLVLLNLFRDQLDRAGEIDRVQDVIVSALASTSDTVLLYNGDDPLCERVARRASRQGTETIPFGIDEDLGLPAERVRGGRFCQQCGAPLRYAWRQYGQLGGYSCPSCDFARPEPAFAARDVTITGDGVAFSAQRAGGSRGVRVSAGWGGAYMVYNLLAAWSASMLAGADVQAFQRAVDAYRPDNGRLQRFEVGGRRVTLNLAKNPTGFNQNIALLAASAAPKLVYIVINDDYNDGKDVSWLWDVDFERIVDDPTVKLCVVGGHRANDMQVRLKYAGVQADIVDGVAGALDRAASLPEDAEAYVLTNYSALWPARRELTELEAAR